MTINEITAVEYRSPVLAQTSLKRPLEDDSDDLSVAKVQKLDLFADNLFSISDLFNHIFSYVEITTLPNIPLVCKLWRKKFNEIDWRRLCHGIDHPLYENEDAKKAYLRLVTKLHILLNSKSIDLITKPVKLMDQIFLGSWMIDHSIAVVSKNTLAYFNYNGIFQNSQLPLGVSFHPCNDDKFEVDGESLLYLPGNKKELSRIEISEKRTNAEVIWCITSVNCLKTLKRVNNGRQSQLQILVLFNKLKRICILDGVSGKCITEFSKDIKFLADNDKVEKISQIDISEQYIWVKYKNQDYSQSHLIKRQKKLDSKIQEQNSILETYDDNIECHLTKNFVIEIDKTCDSLKLPSNILKIRNEKNLVNEIKVPLMCLENGKIEEFDINLMIANQELDEACVIVNYRIRIRTPSNDNYIYKTELFLLQLRNISIIPILLEQDKNVLQIRQDEKCVFVWLNNKGTEELLVFNSLNNQKRILASSTYMGSHLDIQNNHITEILGVQPDKNFPFGQTYLVKSQKFI